MRTRLARVVFCAVAIAIALQWANTRIEALRTNQNREHPFTPMTYVCFHSMAIGLEHGRVGQIDIFAVERYLSVENPAGLLDRDPGGAPPRWVNYYTLDIGYSFIVELARLVFPSLPDNHWRAVALQLVADAALVAFVGFVFAQSNRWLGLLAAYLYLSNVVFQYLVSFAFYYFWDVPLAFVALGSLFLAVRRPSEARRWLTLAALTLALGVWIRGSWWPLSAFLLAVTLSSASLRRHLVVPVTLFALLAAPQVVRSTVARGHLAFTTRATWHVAMVGLGYYPNPYGLSVKDEVVFKRTAEKYGVRYRIEDYEAHDLAARQEFLSILRENPRFVLRSFLGRLEESIVGSTESSVPSFPFVSNVAYRLLCLTGCLAMMALGGERRLLAVMAAGVYLLYVGLTSAFFYVGLAYSGVSEVTLLLLFVGGVESLLPFAARVFDSERDWLWSHG